jgi:hypothetical protein
MPHRSLYHVEILPRVFLAVYLLQGSHDLWLDEDYPEGPTTSLVATTAKDNEDSNEDASFQEFMATLQPFICANLRAKVEEEAASVDLDGSEVCEWIGPSATESPVLLPSIKSGSRITYAVYLRHPERITDKYQLIVSDYGRSEGVRVGDVPSSQPTDSSCERSRVSLLPFFLECVEQPPWQDGSIPVADSLSLHESESSD